MNRGAGPAHGRKHEHESDRHASHGPHSIQTSVVTSKKRFGGALAQIAPRIDSRMDARMKGTELSGTPIATSSRQEYRIL